MIVLERLLQVQNVMKVAYNAVRSRSEVDFAI